jgi:hypothetical protein
MKFKKNSKIGNPPIHDAAHNPGEQAHFHPADRNGERMTRKAHYQYPTGYQSPKK